MKLCVISNSYIASLKLGWDHSHTTHPDVEVDFFGSPAQTMKSLEIEGRTLVSRDPKVAEMFRYTSGGREIIEVDKYDRFLIYGAGLSIHWLVGLYVDFRSDEHCRVGQYLVSPQVFTNATAGMLNDTAAVRTLELLRKLGRTDVILSPNPLPGNGLGGMINREAWMELCDNGDAPKILQEFDTYLARLTEAGAGLCLQRAATRSGLLFTQTEYSAVGGEDDVHKNAAFGSIAMDDVIGYAKLMRDS